MRIHHYGHAAFLLESGSGYRVLIDPYDAQGYEGTFRYEPIAEHADVVLATHQHRDHFSLSGVQGDPEVLLEPGVYEVGGLVVAGIESHHDPSGGAERGRNVMWRVVMDGLRCVHLGDLGQKGLDDAQVRGLAPVDVLFVPVGGRYTIDAYAARQVAARLSPRAVVPMHYKTASVDFPIAPVDEFLVGPEPVVRVGSADLFLTLEDLPPARTIYLLDDSR